MGFVRCPYCAVDARCLHCHGSGVLHDCMPVTVAPALYVTPPLAAVALANHLNALRGSAVAQRWWVSVAAAMALDLRTARFRAGPSGWGPLAFLETDAAFLQSSEIELAAAWFLESADYGCGAVMHLGTRMQVAVAQAAALLALPV